MRHYGSLNNRVIISLVIATFLLNVGAVLAQTTPSTNFNDYIFGKLRPIQANFDVHFYDLDIQINPYKGHLGGWVEMKATALKDIDSIQIDLVAGLDIRELRWETRDGQALAYKREDRAVYIALPKKIKQGDSFRIHTQYWGSPSVATNPPWSGGVVWRSFKWIGVACEIEGASIWFPCKDHTSDEADSVSLHFTIPRTDISIVSNGIFLGSTEKEEAETFHWKVHYPINTYNITFYGGNFVLIEDSLIGIHQKKLKLRHYARKANEQKARKHFEQVKRHIKIFEELFGEYPWYDDGFKLVEAPFGGMEHQTAIAFGSNYQNHPTYISEDFLILHETAHEWFGNAVTAADFADIWLQEGFATYAEFLYLEKVYGYEKAFPHLQAQRLRINNTRKLVGRVGIRDFQPYTDSDVYHKGAWVLHTLRSQIGDNALFFAIMKTYYEENKYKIVDTNTFIQIVNRLTKTDYTWFFAQYLHQKSIPVLEYWAKKGEFYYRWGNVAPNFNKLSVWVSFAENGKDYEIYPSSEVQKLTFSESKPLNVQLSSVNFLYTTKSKAGIVWQYKPR